MAIVKIISQNSLGTSTSSHSNDRGDGLLHYFLGGGRGGGVPMYTGHPRPLQSIEAKETARNFLSENNLVSLRGKRIRATPVN